MNCAQWPTDVMDYLWINASFFCIVWKEKVMKKVLSVLHDFDQSACSRFMSAGQGVAANHICGL